MIRPSARRLGLAGAALAAALVIVLAAASPDGWRHFIRADGISFLDVARNLSGRGYSAGDNAYRYGRMFYPLVAFALALGHRSWLLMALPLVNCLALGVSIAVACELAARSGRSVRAGLVVLGVPALWLCLLIAWCESLLIALLLGFVLCLRNRRSVAASVLLACAVLTKETAALVVVPLVIDALWRRDRRSLVVRAGALVPAALWWTWVWLRVGEWPFLATTPSRTLAIAPPFVGLVQLVGDGVTSSRVCEVVLVLTVAFVGAAVWWRRPSSLVAASAAVMAAFSLCFGFHVLDFWGDTLRVLSPALAMVVVAVLTGTDRAFRSELAERNAKPVRRLLARQLADPDVRRTAARPDDGRMQPVGEHLPGGLLGVGADELVAVLDDDEPPPR